MAGLVPAIHAFAQRTKDVDARDKPAHDRLRRHFGAAPVLCAGSPLCFFGPV